MASSYFLRIASYLSLVVVSLSYSAWSFAETDARTLNNGNLVLEDIPDIPASIVEDLERFQNVRSAPVQGWTLDGNSLYVSTRFGDVAQLHRVDKPGGARAQLTFFKEPLGSIVRQPKGDLIGYTMDAGGSENAQVFIFDPANGESRMLSDGESRNSQLSWRRDGKSVAYQSTRRNGRSNDIWLTDIENPENSKLIMESPDGNWWAPGDWSSDSSKLLVQQYVSITNSSIFLLDAETGALERVRGSESSPTVNYAVAFDKDNKGFFFLTDEGDQFPKLAYQQFGESDFEVISSSIPWGVEQASLNDDRTQMAFSVNAGGLSQLYLMDVRSGNYRMVEGLPIGLIGGVDFSSDGKQLALTLNTAKTPSDSFVLELAKNKLKHGKLTRWTYSEVGGLDTGQFVEPELMSYPTFDKDGDDVRMIPAFVFKPKKLEKPAPVIISIHGGPEAQYVRQRVRCLG